MKATALVAPGTQQFLTLASIDLSKTNPRSHFDKGKLDELADSIRTHGVLVPVLVRPHGKRYELVAGERRLRAAKMAKLDKIPAIVRTLDDKQTLEIQVVENLQREDLQPLEEAEGYALLIKKHGYDADSLALKIGKSRSYVYARIKLAELCESAKKALSDEKISHSVALLIARIPDAKLQAQAAREVRANNTREGMNYRAASDYIQRTYMLRLHDAPWKKNDATLVPEAGACTTCPFRTGNQPALFEDVKSTDVCTAPACFQKKADAFIRREAEENGWQALSAADAKKEFQYGGRLSYGSDFEDLEAQCYKDPKQRTYGELLKKVGGVSVTLAKDGTGKVHKLIAKTDLRKAMKAAGHTFMSPTPPSNIRANNEKYKLEHDLRVAVEQALGTEIQAAVEKIGLTGPVLRAVLIQTLELGDPQGPMERRGVDEAIDAEAWLATLADHQLLAVAVEDLFIREGFNTEEKRRRADVFTSLGIDEKAITARVKAELKSKAKEGKSKGKKAAKVKSGVCRECGCTDANGCPEGCAWVDPAKTLCSSCAPIDVDEIDVDDEADPDLQEAV